MFGNAGNRRPQPGSARGMSTTAALIVGSLLSAAILVAILLVRYIATTYSPTLVNAERLLDRGRYDEALGLAERILAGGKTGTRVLVLKGKVWFAKAWELQEKNGWREYGTNQEKWISSPEIEKALECFRGALQKDPDNSDAHFWLATACRELGWFTEAEQHYERVIELAPQLLDARVALAILYSRMDRLDGALEQLGKAREIDPDNPRVAKNMAFLYRFHLDQPESAMVWFNRYLNHFPERDIDVSVAKRELEDLLARYPEFTLKEEQSWRQQKRRFTPRHTTR